MYAVWLSVCPYVRPLTSVSRDVISRYSVDGFHWNLPPIFATRVGTAEKVFKFRVQRPRSWRGREHFAPDATSRHFSG